MEMEGKMRHLMMALVSLKGAKNENNGKQWDPLGSILNFLMLHFLILIPVICYNIYMANGIFSRCFVDFALSTLLVLLMFAVGSQMTGELMEMEGKMGYLKASLASLTGAKNENNGKQWDPLGSILNFLMLHFLILIPVICYSIYMADGIFSRHFVDFALSTLLVLLMFAVGSKMTGANDEKFEIHGVSINLLLMLLNLIIFSLRLHDVYLTDGIFSYRFAHFALSAFSVVVIHLKLTGLISSGLCMVLMLPGFISYVAALEWNLAFCVTLAGCFFFIIIMFCVVMMCEKSGDASKEKDC